MEEFGILLLIAVGLSMDAFSLALSYGTLELSNTDNIKTSFFVGIFHFFMPILGLLIGNYLVEKLLV